MSRQALAAFESGEDGVWHCRKDVVVHGPHGDVMVRAGTSFAPHTAFAGFNDFTAYLDELAVETAKVAPHEWKEKE